jgi:universal stress protein A
MSVHPQHILWPTDFSALSRHGARYARALCTQFDADLHVIHVLAPSLTPDFATTLTADVPPVVDDPELQSTWAARLAELVGEQFADLTRVHQEVLLGNPWSAICKYAVDADIDLIVVGTHGRTGLPHVLIGSTAERIVQHAPCPVLVVKLPERDFVDDS